MKKLFAVLLLCAVLFPACASAPKQKKSDFTETFNKTWKLSAVRESSGKVIFTEGALSGFAEDTYTIRFSGGQASGTAAPNKYRVPYAISAENGIAFKPAAATLKAAFKEPEGLSERGFLNLLEKVYSWELSKNKLMLHSLNGKNEETVMVFK